MNDLTPPDKVIVCKLTDGTLAISKSGHTSIGGWYRYIREDLYEKSVNDAAGYIEKQTERAKEYAVRVRAAAEAVTKLQQELADAKELSEYRLQSAARSQQELLKAKGERYQIIALVKKHMDVEMVAISPGGGDYRDGALGVLTRLLRDIDKLGKEDG